MASAARLALARSALPHRTGAAAGVLPRSLISTTSLRSFSTSPLSRYAEEALDSSGAPLATRTPVLRDPHYGQPGPMSHHVKGPPPPSDLSVDYSHGPSALDKASRLFFFTEIARGPSCIAPAIRAE